MKSVQLATAYNPRDFEDRLYRFWLDRNVFAPDMTGDKPPYVIVIPPPNVTGVLHMGHGLNNCLQDILVRYHRMLGQPTLWLPGSDHAGIATQNVVEKRLKARGTSKEKLGREKFLEETWKVKEEHHRIIVEQLQKIGASCDWQRERFTLDEGLSRAVREVFVALFNKGLVYRGNYLINWCSTCGTAISDDEVEHEEIPGKMYHYLYPLAEGRGHIEIATTRPETMLGDVAVAVHPEDERYRQLVGKLVELPLTDRQIPVIADSFVDMAFGTGAVKVTPGHDPADYEFGVRHKLPRINILNPDSTLNGNVPPAYRGLPVLEARRRVVADLKSAGLFIREEDYAHQVGHCYRCHSVIEPYLSDQWFVKMKPLAEKALAAWEEGKVTFYPRKWENTYAHWLRTIRDWCISRQLWWGHRIPVWYCRDCQGMTVASVDPDSCSHCGSGEIRQDPDVLDTWFSSALWPFSTLGWPEDTEDLRRFYPTSTLVTGYDIIFFWVARMIMMGMEFRQEIPFHDVYIHGLVRDIQGRKMSKSLGNGIDPLEVVEEYGADALKFTIAFLAAQGQDILLDKETFKLGSKFANKIWNASRFILMNLEGRNLLRPGEFEQREADRWILHRLNETVKSSRGALDSYRFNEAAQAVYGFFWNDYCDWYIEASKPALYADDPKEKDRSITLLLSVLEESLRLLHPLLPFLTEEIYQKLPRECRADPESSSLASSPYPGERAEREDREAEAHFGLLQELVRGVRTIRSELTIPFDTKIRVAVKTEAGSPGARVFRQHQTLICELINCQSLSLTEEAPDRTGSLPVLGSVFEAFVYVREVIDTDKELAKLKKQREKSSAAVERAEKKLANPVFLDKAPPEVVAKERAKLEELGRSIKKIESYIHDLKA
jgi:valyl-tRNA synthetase